MGLFDRVKAMFKNVDLEADPEPEPVFEPEPEPEPVPVPEPIVLVAGAGPGVSGSNGSGFTDYYCRETGAHVQAVQRQGAFRLHTAEGDFEGEAGDYWVRPLEGYPRIVKRAIFEARFAPKGE